MKRLIFFLFLSMVTLALRAVPARPGQWRTVTLADGSTVRVELRGDEHLHFWQDADGQRYEEGDDGIFQRLTPTQQARQQRRAVRRRLVQQRRLATRRQAMRRQEGYTGKKRGLVLLVDFSDKQFQAAYDSVLFTRMLNEPGFADEGAKGSVADYFRDQSNGRFELAFDVVGPIRVTQKSTYYGGKAQDGSDEPVNELVTEACRKADAYVNYQDYDWDGDGEVDQVFIIYAGKGQADGGGSTTIWPHEWELTSYDGGTALTLDGVTVDTYACAAELNGSGNLCGIGTVCHEFSHCLGFPDVYDTNYEGYFGLGHFDLMSEGNYNDDGHTPPCYTSWERWTAGWLTPTELTDSTLQVDSLQPLSENGGAYIIYNEGNRNEYYLLENRQKTGWDKSIYCKGLLIMHVDYDEKLFYNNIVNTIVSDADARVYYEGLTTGNDHERMTLFHAGGTNVQGDYNITTEIKDLYPYGSNNSLTKTSSPEATVYNKNTDGTLYMNRSVTDITQNDDGTVSFHFTIDGYSGAPSDTTDSDIVVKGDTLLCETFDQCRGTGGNDDLFSGNIAQGTFTPDLTGWTASKAYGGDQCARFGTGSKAGLVLSPSFAMPGDTLTLSFRAAGWTGDGTSLQVYLGGVDEINPTAGIVGDDGALTTETSLTLTPGAWTTFTLRLVGKASGASLTFYPSRRFFLDDVLVRRTHPATPDATAIRGIKLVSPSEETPLSSRSLRVYNLAGQLVGTSLDGLQHGIYIVNGKKVIR